MTLLECTPRAPGATAGAAGRASPSTRDRSGWASAADGLSADREQPAHHGPCAAGKSYLASPGTHLLAACVARSGLAPWRAGQGSLCAAWQGTAPHPTMASALLAIMMCASVVAAAPARAHQLRRSNSLFTTTDAKGDPVLVAVKVRVSGARGAHAGLLPASPGGQKSTDAHLLRLDAGHLGGSRLPVRPARAAAAR